MTRRTLALAALLLIPALALIGWFVYEQLPTWQIPAWLQPGSGSAVRGACEALASMRTYGATFTNDTTALSAADARAKADALVVQQTDLPTGNYADSRGPSLVRATFPGVGPRLAWLNVAVRRPAIRWRSSPLPESTTRWWPAAAGRSAAASWCANICP